MPIEFHLPFAEYQAREGISKHDLDVFADSAMHYRAKKGKPNDPTPAMIFGNLVHCQLFEPSQVFSRYAIRPEETKGNSKAAKAHYEAFKIHYAAHQIIEDKDLLKAKSMVESILKHSDASALVDDIKETELSVFTEHDGISRRSRIDARTHSNKLFDLKTTTDASEKGFQKDTANFTYYIQDPYYLDNIALAGEPAEGFAFIFVEKEYPFAVATYELGPVSREKGRSEYNALLARYRQCVEWDIWPGYSPNRQTVELPAWALKQ